MNMKHIAQFVIYFFAWVTVLRLQYITTGPIHQYHPLHNIYGQGKHFRRYFSIFCKINNSLQSVNHHQSFNSLVCNTKLNSKLYPDSKIGAKQKRGLKQKLSSQIYWHRILCKQLKKNIEKVPFHWVLTDASNQNAEKLFPFIIQYFSETKGKQLKLIKLDYLGNETSATIVKFCINTLIILIFLYIN